MSKLLAANWKENPKTEKDALKLFREVGRAADDKVQVVLCPPFIYLDELAHAFKKIACKKHLALGAQDAFWQEKGPFTSEVGPRMLKALGARYVIIGHSERRKWAKETDAIINKKIKLARADGLKVILCVGEPLAVRKKGIPAAQKFVAAQLSKDFAGLKPRDRAHIIVAYEPIWAIGTGRYDEPEDARGMAEFIKRKLGKPAPIVLYGGSVTSKNVADYVQYSSIDGALVGGASLKAAEFKKIINICQTI
ncbi:MAG TPA: triose-phosphate isomerase [Candidatus Paceibacterota bacterium]|jgi:triosephosphate isomerase|nr:triose-phosphate isomerase [Candidatus Paceibacterota bacterium]